MLSELDRIEIYEAEEFMDGEEGQKERFKVKDLNSANWCLRKIAALEKQQKEAIELAETEMLRIKEWLDSKKVSIERSRAFFEGLLTEYLFEKRMEDKGFKISTPYGSVSTRKSPDKWIYNDEVVINWLKGSQLSGYIRVKEEVDKVKVKSDFDVVNGQVVSSDGEIVEGIRVDEQSEKVVIKVKGDI